MDVMIVDDEPLARRGIRMRLARHSDVNCIDECRDGEEALVTLLERKMDIVFMDVEMPGLSGLEVVHRLPIARRPLTILLTAHDQYAVRAFEINVLDYLLKPIDDSRFDEALDRARFALNVRNNAKPVVVNHVKRFMARVGRRDIVIDADAIEWIEASGDYVGLHVGQKTHLIREKMHDIHRALDPKKFIRIHRSTIVRIDRVAELEALSNSDCIVRLLDDRILRASRSYVALLRLALAQRSHA
jgi:two-component system LytT family response regulator